MPSQIPLATASELFDPTVTVVAQNSQYLFNTIKERHGTTGQATNVPVSDLIEMQQISYAPTDIPITPYADTNNMIIPYNYALKTVIGGGQETLFAYDSVTDQMISHGMAVGRNEDLIKIQGIYNDPNVGSILTVPYTVGPTTGLNEQKLAMALDLMADQGWDVGNLQTSLWAPVLTKTSFTSDPLVTNFFYNDQRPLPKYSIKSYLDVDLRFLGSNGTNSIPYTTTDEIRTYLVPLVHTNAMVQIYNRDPQSRVNWLDWEDRYDLISTMTTGAAIIQYSGIVFIEVQYPFANNSMSSAVIGDIGGADNSKRKQENMPMRASELMKKRGIVMPKIDYTREKYFDLEARAKKSVLTKCRPQKLEI